MSEVTSIRCPSCGSANFSTNYEERPLSLAMGKPSHYTAVVNECRDCGMKGDFSRQNDKTIAELLVKARGEIVESVINELNAKGYSMAYMERALELPQRTMMRWKSGEYSAAGLALLRFVQTYPWLLSVADSKFDLNDAKEILICEAIRTFTAMAEVSRAASAYGMMLSTSGNFLGGIGAAKINKQKPEIEISTTGALNTIAEHAVGS